MNRDKSVSLARSLGGAALLAALLSLTLGCPASCRVGDTYPGMLTNLGDIQRACMEKKTPLERAQCCDYYGLGCGGKREKMGKDK